MKRLLVISLLLGSVHLGKPLAPGEKLPAAVYNPWFSYTMLKWLVATNPDLAAELLRDYPRGTPVQYHTLAGTAVHLASAGPSSRLFDLKIRRHPFKRTDNFLNSQVSGLYKQDRLV